MNKLSSRKLWLGIGIIALLTAMTWFNKVDQNNYVNALLTLFAVYSGANVVTKFTPKK